MRFATAAQSCWHENTGAFELKNVLLWYRLVHVFKNWKLLFENIYKNMCGWKNALKCVKYCLKTQTKHPLYIALFKKFTKHACLNFRLENALWSLNGVWLVLQQNLIFFPSLFAWSFFFLFQTYFIYVQLFKDFFFFSLSKYILL